MHRSQRTGRETWAIRLSTAAAPSVTSAPSKLDSNGTCGFLRVQRRTQGLQGRARGGHVRGVERARDLQRDDPGLGRRVLRQGLELLQGAGGDGLAGPVDVGGRGPGGVNGCQDLGGVAAHDGTHAGGGGGSSGCHAVGAFADKRHGFGFRQDTGEGSGGDFADGVAGKDDGKRAEFDVEQRLCRHQARSDDQGLRDCGVLDGLLIGGGAVGGEVDACYFAEGGQEACDGWQFQPGGQKTRGLGALSRADDCKHVTSFPNYRVNIRVFMHQAHWVSL